MNFIHSWNITPHIHWVVFGEMEFYEINLQECQYNNLSRPRTPKLPADDNEQEIILFEDQIASLDSVQQVIENLLYFETLLDGVALEDIKATVYHFYLKKDKGFWMSVNTSEFLEKDSPYSFVQRMIVPQYLDAVNDSQPCDAALYESLGTYMHYDAYCFIYDKPASSAVLLQLDEAYAKSANYT